MAINKDFEDLFHHLNCVRARYLVVGAYAVIYHTEPRYTKDIDILVEPSERNAKKVYQALARFGAPLRNLRLEDLVNTKMVYQIGVEPNRIDILMGIGRVSFEDAWKKKCVSHYGKEKIYILDLENLIQAKKAAGRSRDQSDLEVLGEVVKRKKKHSKPF